MSEIQASKLQAHWPVIYSLYSTADYIRNALSMWWLVYFKFTTDVASEKIFFFLVIGQIMHVRS